MKPGDRVVVARDLRGTRGYFIGHECVVTIVDGVEGCVRVYNLNLKKNMWFEEDELDLI